VYRRASALFRGNKPKTQVQADSGQIPVFRHRVTRSIRLNILWNRRLQLPFYLRSWYDSPFSIAEASRIKANDVQSKIADIDPLCWLEFTEDSIITSCKSGKLLQSHRAVLSFSNNVRRPHPNMGPTRNAVMEMK
jgi:hypothetical protein